MMHHVRGPEDPAGVAQAMVPVITKDRRARTRRSIRPSWWLAAPPAPSDSIPARKSSDRHLGAALSRRDPSASQRYGLAAARHHGLAGCFHASAIPCGRGRLQHVWSFLVHAQRVSVRICSGFRNCLDQFHREPGRVRRSLWHGGNSRQDWKPLRWLGLCRGIYDRVRSALVAPPAKGPLACG